MHGGESGGIKMRPCELLVHHVNFSFREAEILQPKIQSNLACIIFELLIFSLLQYSIIDGYACSVLD